MENLDDLFDVPQEDIVVEEPEVDHRAQFEESDKIKVTGSFSVTGVAAAGWNNWDFFQNVDNGFDASAGLKSGFSLTLDARPAPQIKIYASLSSSFNPYASLSKAFAETDNTDSTDEDTLLEPVWTAPAFGDLYIDYILMDTLFTRLGKFSFSWGQGRFYTPGNLMADSKKSAFNFRFSFPTLFGLSFVMLTNNSTFYKDFTYGAKIDFVFGETLISPAVAINYWNGADLLLSLKQVIFKTDFLIDVTARVDDIGLEHIYVVAGFFRDWSDVQLYGEYQYSWLLSTGHNHLASLALGLNNPFGAPFDLGIQVEQSFVDWSGSITPVYTQNIFPYMKMTIGLPIIYGEDGSYAVAKNSDPSKRRIALGVALKLSASF